MTRRTNRIPLGPTGRYPRGPLGPEDEGELRFAIASDPKAHKVVVDFGKPIAWLGMDPADAERLASALLDHARRARGEGGTTTPDEAGEQARKAMDIARRLRELGGES